MTNETRFMTPHEAFTAAIAAVNTEDWHGLTSLCDPLSLRVFKRRMVDFLSSLQSDFDFVAGIPDFSAPGRSMPNTTSWHLKHEVAGVSSLEELRDMDPGRVFVRWLQARCFPRYFDAADEPWESDPDSKPLGNRRKKLSTFRYSVLGSVPDGPELAHVVYRPAEGMDESYPEAYEKCMKTMPEDERLYMTAMLNRGDPMVATCRRQEDGSWRIFAKRNFFLLDSMEIVEVRRDSES